MRVVQAVCRWHGQDGRSGQRIVGQPLDTALCSGQPLVLALNLADALFQVAGGGLHALQCFLALRMAAPALTQLLFKLAGCTFAPHLDITGGILEHHAQL